MIYPKMNRYHNFISTEKVIIHKYISKHLLFVDNNLQRIFMGEIDLNINNVFKLT